MAHRVQLALYDLSRGLAKTMSMAILGKQIDGIWHTGLIVYGKEYFFGGGLQSMPHDVFVEMHGGERPKEYIELGFTDLSQDVFEDFNREINPRYTAQTYDLMKHNCNNYTDESAKFLLGKGIPSYIIDLPNEVLNSPMGGMLRPMLEQMTTQMNGADPYSALHTQQQQQQQQPASFPAAGAGASSPSTAAAATPPPQATTSGGAASERSCAAAQNAGYPIMDKHIKPLVGSDTSKAAPGVAARLKALGAGVEGLLSAEEGAVLDNLPASLAAPKTTPVTPGSFRLMQKVLTKTSGWPAKAEFLALILMSLMVLHNAEGQEMEDAMAAVAARAQAEGDLSSQSLSIAICTAANAFGTPGGGKYMVRSDVIPGWLDASLRGLQHERSEVRQMSSSLLNNFSLGLVEGLPETTEGLELSDEVTQVLFGSLEGLEDEKSQVVALRRLLSAGRLVRKFGSTGATLVNEVGLGDQVGSFLLSKAMEGEAKGAAQEVLRLLGKF
eukprot:jgi/Undpi1/12335/HiC_scaffold_5.g02011.m1